VGYWPTARRSRADWLRQLRTRSFGPRHRPVGPVRSLPRSKKVRQWWCRTRPASRALLARGRRVRAAQLVRGPRSQRRASAVRPIRTAKQPIARRSRRVDGDHHPTVLTASIIDGSRAVGNRPAEFQQVAHQENLSSERLPGPDDPGPKAVRTDLGRPCHRRGLWPAGKQATQAQTFRFSGA
jgi:hypothetical protein